MHVCTYALTETPRGSGRFWPHFTDRKTEARDELSNAPMVAAWALWGSGCWARVGTLPVKGQRAGVLALGASLRHGGVATPHVNGETRIQPPASARGLSTEGRRCCTPALPLASGAPQVLWESHRAESPAARAHTEPLRTHAPGGQRPCYLGRGAQNRGQGVPLQEVGQLGRAAQGPAGLQPVGGLRGAGLRVAERHAQRVRGGLGQLGAHHPQVGQVRGTVQAAAQPGAVGRVLRCGGA